MSTMCSSKSSGTRVGVLRRFLGGTAALSLKGGQPDDSGSPGRFSGVTDATYPRHWEADVLLRDGGTAHVRPVSPDDSDLLVSFYEQVSSQSKYYRFFAAMPTLSEREIRRFVDVDHRNRVALILTVAERMIA